MNSKTIESNVKKSKIRIYPKKKQFQGLGALRVLVHAIVLIKNIPRKILENKK